MVEMHIDTYIREKKRITYKFRTQLDAFVRGLFGRFKLTASAPKTDIKLFIIISSRAECAIRDMNFSGLLWKRRGDGIAGSLVVAFLYFYLVIWTVRSYTTKRRCQRARLFKALDYHFFRLENKTTCEKRALNSPLTWRVYGYMEQVK